MLKFEPIGLTLCYMGECALCIHPQGSVSNYVTQSERVGGFQKRYYFKVQYCMSLIKWQSKRYYRWVGGQKRAKNALHNYGTATLINLITFWKMFQMRSFFMTLFILLFARSQRGQFSDFVFENRVAEKFLMAQISMHKIEKNIFLFFLHM